MSKIELGLFWAAAQRTPYALRAAMHREGKVELVRDWVAPEASLTALIATSGVESCTKSVALCSTLPHLLVACHPQGHNARADPSPLDQSPRRNEGWIGNARLTSTLGRVKGTE